MGNRNPFQIKMVVNEENYNKLKNDRHKASYGGVVSGDEIITPWRSSCCFEEFDSNNLRFSVAYGMDTNTKVITINGHSSAAYATYILEVIEKYSDEFAFVVLEGDGEYPVYIRRGEVFKGHTFCLHGLCEIRRDKDAFYFKDLTELGLDKTLDGVIFDNERNLWVGD